MVSVTAVRMTSSQLDPVHQTNPEDCCRGSAISDYLTFVETEQRDLSEME